MLLHRRAPGGQILETNLVSDDFSVIARDPGGRGFMNSWELVTPGRRIYMHEPLNGHFQMMDIEQITAKVVYSLSFNRTTSGTYRLFKVKPRLRLPQFSEVQSKIIVGCEVAEKKLQVLAGDVMDALKKENSSLDGKLNERGGLLDSSCSTGDYAGKRGEAVKAGIKEVFESDKVWSKELAEETVKNSPTRSVKTQGKFLQCLRYHRLDHHASRIESALATYLHLGEGSFAWKIDCKKPTEEVRGMDIWGSYLPQVGGPPTIKIYDQYDSSGKIRDRGNADPSYAKTFFHEMLHYSLIPDGAMQESVDACCSQDNPETTECRKLDRLVLEQENMQRVSNQVCSRLEKIRKGMCAEWHEEVRQAMDGKDKQKAEIAMEEMHKKIGGVYQRLAESSARCKVESFNDMSPECREALKSGIDSVIKESFSSASNKERREHLQDFARHIYGGSSLGSGCPTSTAYLWSFKAGLLARLQGFASWMVPYVSAAVGFNKCEVTNDKTSADNSWRSFPASSYVPPMPEHSMLPTQGAWDIPNESGGISNFSMQPSEGIKDNAASGGSKPTWGAPVSGSGPKRYPQRPSDGPPRPHFESDNATERQVKIMRDISDYKRTNSAADRLTADLVKGTVINEARADSETPSRRGNRAEAGKYDRKDDRKTERGRESPTVDVAVKPTELPDPIAHLTSPSLSGLDVGSTSLARGEANPKPSRPLTITGSDRGPASFAGANDRSPKGASSSTEGSRNLAQVTDDGRTDEGGPSSGLGAGKFPEGNGEGTGKATAPSGPVKSSGKTSGAQGSPKKQTEKSREKGADVRAARALLKQLQNKKYFDRVKPELSRPSVEKSMRRHLIQVKDDEGRIHGAESPVPERKLIYCQSEKHLVLVGQCKK